MKIDIDDINYHHEYSVSLVFDATSIASSASASTQKTESSKSQPTSSATTTESQVPNPQTDDATPYLLIVALVGSAFLLYRKKLQTKTEGQ